MFLVGRSYSTSLNQCIRDTWRCSDRMGLVKRGNCARPNQWNILKHYDTTAGAPETASALCSRMRPWGRREVVSSNALKLGFINAEWSFENTGMKRDIFGLVLTENSPFCFVFNKTHLDLSQRVELHPNDNKNEYIFFTRLFFMSLRVFVLYSTFRLIF